MRPTFSDEEINELLQRSQGKPLEKTDDEKKKEYLNSVLTVIHPAPRTIQIIDRKNGNKCPYCGTVIKGRFIVKSCGHVERMINKKIIFIDWEAPIKTKEREK
jgi:hypothetical protein